MLKMWGDSRDAELSGVRTEQQRAPLERDGFFVVLEGSPVGDLGVANSIARGAQQTEALIFCRRWRID